MYFLVVSKWSIDLTFNNYDRRFIFPRDLTESSNWRCSLFHKLLYFGFRFWVMVPMYTEPNSLMNTIFLNNHTKCSYCSVFAIGIWSGVWIVYYPKILQATGYSLLVYNSTFGKCPQSATITFTPIVVVIIRIFHLNWIIASQVISDGSSKKLKNCAKDFPFIYYSTLYMIIHTMSYGMTDMSTM